MNTLLSVLHRQKTNMLHIFALDYSGSKSSEHTYFDSAKKFLDDFERASRWGRKLYMISDDECKIVSKKELMDMCKRRHGRNDTHPPNILKQLKISSKHELKQLLPGVDIFKIPLRIWLLTDGENSPGDVEECTQLAASFSISQMTVMIINDNQDVSVALGFMKNCQAKIYFNGDMSEPILEANMSKPFDYAAIDHLNIDEMLPKLQDYICLKKMVSPVNAISDIEHLTATKNRILDQMRELAAPSAVLMDSVQKLRDNIHNSPYFKILTSSIATNNIKDVGSKFDRLMGFIQEVVTSMNLYWTRGRLGSETARLWYTLLQRQESSESFLSTYPTCDFMDPITLEYSGNQPVLLLNTRNFMDVPLFHRLSTLFREIACCPLISPAQKLTDFIGNVISVDSYYELIKLSESGHPAIILNPTTRQECMGIFLDSRFDEYNDNALMHILFKSRKIPNPLPLWYYMIWKIACHCDWMGDDVKTRLQEYVIHRIVACRKYVDIVFFNINSRALFTPVPIHVACYYGAVLSSELLANDVSNFRQEEMRKYTDPVAAVEMMLDIVEIAEKGAISEEVKCRARERANIFECVATLRLIPNKVDKVHWFLSRYFEVSQLGFLTWQPKSQNSHDVRLFAILDIQGHKTPIQMEFLNAVSVVDISKYIHVIYGGMKDVSQLKIHPSSLRPIFKLDGPAKVPYYEEVLRVFHDVRVNVDVHRQRITSERTQSLSAEKQKIDQSRLISVFGWFVSYVKSLAPSEDSKTIDEMISLDAFVEYAKTNKWKHGTKVVLFPPEVDETFKNFWEFYATRKPLKGLPLGVVNLAFRNSNSIRSRLLAEKSFEDSDPGANDYAVFCRSKYLAQSKSKKSSVRES